VAQGKCRLEAAAEALKVSAPNIKEGVPAGLAPAHGLTLIEVTYPPVEVQSE
jgi:hypothetical protein